MPLRLLAALLLAALLLAPATAAADWPQFRGPGGDGVVGKPLPLAWDAATGEHIAWTVPIDGEGWSAPVVAGGTVYLTAAVPTDAAAAAGPDEYRGGGGRNRSDLQSVDFRYEVLALDAATGRERWRTVTTTRKPPMPRHSSNTYATETPIVDLKAADGEGRIYAAFGMVGVFALTLDGEVVWTRDLGQYRMRAGWGTSSSPVLHDGRLFLQVDNEDQSFLVALDAATGETVWRVDRDERSQYSSPLAWRNSSRTEIVCGGTVARSYDPADGTLLWSLDMELGRSSATPTADGDTLYLGTEFRNRGGSDDGGGYLFAITPGGSGDITPPAGAASSEFIRWKVPGSNIQMASPVVAGGLLFLPERRSGAVNCVDAATGERVYRERVRGAQAFWASPLATELCVYCLDSGGTTHVLAATRDYTVLATNPLGEQTWSTPAAADGALFIRTATDLVCIRDAAGTAADDAADDAAPE